MASNLKSLARSNTVESAVEDVAEYRIRFLNFNMANSGHFDSPATLPGHLGPGTFDDVWTEPFVDGKPIDVAFSSLVETRAEMEEWHDTFTAEAQKKEEGDPEGAIDKLVVLSAAAASQDASASVLRGAMEALAVGYNGNLKTVLGYNSKKFTMEEGVCHGRLPETTVMGVPIPNPKKAFTGSPIVDPQKDFRFIFAGAHFPIEKISEMFEHGGDPLHGAKLAMAKVLRKILRRAARRGMLDTNSMFILQGDLNSRSILYEQDGELAATDLLQEILKDTALQAAIQTGLSLPSGRWHEVVLCEPAALPVTYKYHDKAGSAFQKKGAKDDKEKEPEVGEEATESAPLATEKSANSQGSIAPLRSVISFLDEVPPEAKAVTIGDVMQAAQGKAKAKGIEEGDFYKRTMLAVGKEQLDAWGLVFKKDSFRAFRFPASADRIIYWAPFGLSQRVKWILPEGGYKVHHDQEGSDHRPVTVEALLRISPPAEICSNLSFQYAGDSANSSFIEAPLPTGGMDALAKEVCDADDMDSDEEVIV